MALYITSGNIRNHIGRRVFDPSVQNEFGIGIIDSTFTVSGEFGCNVIYTLERKVINTSGQMSGLIVHGPVSGNLSTGGSYIDYAQMQQNYLATHPIISGDPYRDNNAGNGGSFTGMIYDPHVVLTDASGTGFIDIGVFGEAAWKLVPTIFYNSGITYYPADVAAVSGLPSVYSLILL